MANAIRTGWGLPYKCHRWHFFKGLRGGKATPETSSACDAWKLGAEGHDRGLQVNAPEGRACGGCLNILAIKSGDKQKQAGPAPTKRGPSRKEEGSSPVPSTPAPTKRSAAPSRDLQEPRAPALAKGALVEVKAGEYTGMIGTVIAHGTVMGDGRYAGVIDVEDARGQRYGILPRALRVLDAEDVHQAVHESPPPDVTSTRRHTAQQLPGGPAPVQDNPPIVAIVEDITQKLNIMEEGEQRAQESRAAGDMRILAIRMPSGRMTAIAQASKKHKMSQAAIINAAIEIFFSMNEQTTTACLESFKHASVAVSEELEVKRSTNKVTRTVMVIEDTWHPNATVTSRDGRWAARCETHGKHHSYTSKQLAHGAISVPWNWCSGCKDKLLGLGVQEKSL